MLPHIIKYVDEQERFRRWLFLLLVTHAGRIAAAQGFHWRSAFEVEVHIVQTHLTAKWTE